MAKDWYKYLPVKEREAAEKYEVELKKLQDSARQHARAEAKFWKEIDARKDEVAEHLGLKNDLERASKLNEALQKYGCSEAEFWEYVLSQGQVSYYRNTHQKSYGIV